MALSAGERRERLEAKQTGIRMATETFNRSLQAYITAVGANVEAAVKKAAVDLVVDIAVLSPVDTGRFRSGWFPFIEAYGGSAPPPSGPNVSAEAMAEGQEQGSYEESRDERAGSFGVTITNAVRYGIYLEYGHSRQAPQGMVRLSMARHAERLREAVREAGA